MIKENITQEEFSVSGADVIGVVKKIIKAGNVKKISIKNEKGKTIIEIPLTIGVVGAALLPVWAAIGAAAALITKCRIVVERNK